MEKEKVSTYGSTYILRHELVPEKDNYKEIVEQYDLIDNLTEQYVRDLALLLGVEIKDFVDDCISNTIRDKAIQEIRKEFPCLLVKNDFDF